MLGLNRMLIAFSYSVTCDRLEVTLKTYWKSIKCSILLDHLIEECEMIQSVSRWQNISQYLQKNFKYCPSPYLF